MFSWKIINEDYLNYLRQHENRIPKTDYGNGKIKPFFGDLFTIDDLVYVTQVSSPKPRHRNLKETIDFVKLFNNKDLLAVINLNYMFPVPESESELSDLKYKKLDDYINFSSAMQKSQYINLLKKEMSIIQVKPIENKAIKLYSLKSTDPDNPISKRSFDFKQLEILANAYLKELLPV